MSFLSALLALRSGTLIGLARGKQRDVRFHLDCSKRSPGARFRRDRPATSVKVARQRRGSEPGGSQFPLWPDWRNQSPLISRVGHRARLTPPPRIQLQFTRFDVAKTLLAAASVFEPAHRINEHQSSNR